MQESDERRPSGLPLVSLWACIVAERRCIACERRCFVSSRACNVSIQACMASGPRGGVIVPRCSVVGSRYSVLGPRGRMVSTNGGDACRARRATCRDDRVSFTHRRATCETRSSPLTECDRFHRGRSERAGSPGQRWQRHCMSAHSLARPRLYGRRLAVLGVRASVCVYTYCPVAATSAAVQAPCLVS